MMATIGCYIRFNHILGRSSAKAVLIANHYSPESLALAAVAHRRGVKVIFANHANATWDSEISPPLYSDIAAVSSQAVLDILQKHTPVPIRSVFLPIRSLQNPMKNLTEEGTPLDVGIFLTALTNMECLEEMISELDKNPIVQKILIRSHPMKIVNSDLSALRGRFASISETVDMPLNENIKQCELAICGNSSVTVEILRAGVPVFYQSKLDELHYDYNGYIANCLVLPMPTELDARSLAETSDFYCSKKWVETMQYFDAGYMRDEAEMYAEVSDALQKVLGK